MSKVRITKFSPELQEEMHVVMEKHGLKSPVRWEDWPQEEKEIKQKILKEWTDMPDDDGDDDTKQKSESLRADVIGAIKQPHIANFIY